MWQLLMLTREIGKPAQLTCEECFALLEYDAEMLASGAVSDEIHLAINRHLSICPACRTKFDAWLKELDGEGPHHLHSH